MASDNLPARSVIFCTTTGVLVVVAYSWLIFICVARMQGQSRGGLGFDKYVQTHRRGIAAMNEEFFPEKDPVLQSESQINKRVA